MVITPGLEVLPAPEAAPGGSVPASAPRRRCRGLSRGRGGSELRGGGGRKREREREGAAARLLRPSAHPLHPSPQRWSRRAPSLLFTWGSPRRRDSAPALPPAADGQRGRDGGRRAGRGGRRP